MSTLNITSEEKAIARKIKLFLEDIQGTCTVEEIFKHLTECEQLTATIKSKEKIAEILNTLTFETKEDIANILRKKYVENTVQALLCKIAKTPCSTLANTHSNIVWDCSVCTNESSFLKEFFFKKDNDATYSPMHIFLFQTFRELLGLSRSTNPTTQMHSSNASKILRWVVDDSNNHYSIAENVTNPDPYTDNTLVNYCLTNNCSLFTQDCYLAVIAKSLGIDVLINFIPSNKEQRLFQYKPTENGKTIIIDESCLPNLSLQNILAIAKSEECGRFLITPKLAACFEKKKKTFRCRCKEFVHFLIMDTDNQKAFYSGKKEESFGIIELAKKHDGFVITSNIETAFHAKLHKISYRYVAPKEHSTTPVSKPTPTSENTTKPETPVVEKVSIQPTPVVYPTFVEEKLVPLPRFNSKTSEISFEKSRKHTNVRIHVFDKYRKLLTPTNETVKIQEGYFVVEITRTCNPEEAFTIKEITVVFNKDTLKGKVTYSKEYTKKTFSEVRNDLRGIAEAATIML